MLDGEELQFDHFGLAFLDVSHHNILHTSNIHGVGGIVRNRNP